MFSTLKKAPSGYESTLAGTMRTCFFVTSALAITGRIVGICARVVGVM
jgi:hypothetical protein